MPYQENKGLESLLLRLESCFTENLPFVVYRKPHESALTGIFQHNDAIHYSVEFEEQGFVFAPFDFKENAILTKADDVVSVVFNYDRQQTHQQSPNSDIGKEDHLRLVEKGVSEINSGKLRKVVLSTRMEVTLDQKPQAIFQKLLKSYPNAFCYLWFHPKVGTWCGATPETLVKVKENELSTMSLAATLPYAKGAEPAWGEKEIDEQGMVSEYISERLSMLTHELNIGKPEAVRAGNLWHLRSEITGKLTPGSLGKVVNALHPTPAVCGIPKEEAKSFIDQHESYKRSYYTGFLGELNVHGENEVSLYVNLRCMEIVDGSASLFVGGGITAASDPEKEWTEIQNKSRTLLNVL